MDEERQARARARMEAVAEADKLLSDATDSYVSFFHAYIVLDGEYTAEQLRAIADKWEELDRAHS